KRRAKERLGEKLEIESRAKNADSQLQQAEAVLDTGLRTLRTAQGGLEFAKRAGAPLEAATVDSSTLENKWTCLAAAQTELREIKDMVGRVRELTVMIGDEEEEDRLERLRALFARALVSIGEVDARLDSAANRLAELQSDAKQLHEKTSSRILWTS